MSFVTTEPQMLCTAAGQLQSIGAVISEQNAIVAGCTTEVAPAAADEVSALTAVQFSVHAIQYQAVSSQASAIRELFVATLQTAADSYSGTEFANVASVR